MDPALFLLAVGALAAVALVVVFVVRAQRARRTLEARSVGPRERAEEDQRWEARRQAAVDSTGILDTPRDDRYDRIVTMARQLYGTDAAIFTIIDRDREWHKAMDGTEVDETKRTTSFCSVTIRGEGALMVGDASKDDRFLDQPAVTGNPNVRFYAGYPVEVGGHNIGALCVYDAEPRELSEFDDSMLKNLASLIEAELRVDSLESRR